MSPTPAERAALRVAEAAAQTPDSAYGLPSAIVFALGSAGLLMDSETAAELDEYRRQFPAMNEALAQASGQVTDMAQQLASASASMDTATKAIQADGVRITALEKDLHEARAARSDDHDDLVAALGRKPGMEWPDLIDIATTAMRTAEGLEATGTKALRDRVAELEALVLAAGSSAEQRHQLLDPSEPPLGCFMTGDICAIAIADALADPLAVDVPPAVTA